VLPEFLEALATQFAVYLTNNTVDGSLNVAQLNGLANGGSRAAREGGRVSTCQVSSMEPPG